jgi:hypothetical protein
MRVLFCDKNRSDFRSYQFWWTLDICRAILLLETNRCCPALMVESFAAIDVAVSSSRGKCHRILSNYECYRQLLNTTPTLKCTDAN